MNIITLTFNPAYDTHCHINEFKPFSENFGEIISCDAGGKGINISRALKSADIVSKAITVICTENGTKFRESLNCDGIDFHEISVSGRIRENITIHSDSAKETRISFPGFDCNDDLLVSFENKIRSLLDDNTYITFTGSLPKGISKDRVKDLIKKLKEKNVKIIIDSRSFEFEDIIELKPWLIKPNQQEISNYIGSSVNDPEDAIEVAKAIHKYGVENVLITLGNIGAVLASNQGNFIALAPKIDAVSTIGAGDSTIAGFLAGEKDKLSSKEKLKKAIAFGSAACLTAGTLPPNKSDINSIMNTVIIKSL